MSEYIENMMERARTAQKEVESYSQEKIDAIVRMFGKVVYDNAEQLARLAIDESRMGVYEDKVKKNQGKPRVIWNSLKGKKSVGILAEYPHEGITEVAKPMGVVAAVTPCTNPVVTPMCNAMFALKCANVIIVAPHPRGKKVAKRLTELYYPELDRLGVPRDVFQVIEDPSIELTGELMKAADVVIATGGGGMVKSAYSCGKPAFGVGPGNVQCIFDRGIDFEEAAKKVIEGRAFDNGIICSGEQTIIAPKESYDEIIQCFVRNAAYYIDAPDDVAKIRNAVFPEGAISRSVVGQGVETILSLAGLAVPEPLPRVLIVKPDAFGGADLLSKEKMCPLMCAYSYDTWEDAVEIAYQNLCVEGKGHSVSLHSNDGAHIESAGEKLPVSRVVVNQVSSTMAGGSLLNGLNPTTTLGCGSWGNNSISENLSYFHLMNKTRISVPKPNAIVPDDDEIWS